MLLLGSICAVSLILNFILVIKVVLLRKAANQIRVGFSERMEQDTNTLISISSRDRKMLALAETVNSQLRLLRQERLQYRQGDRELKEAVTNISHDLRTPLTAICGYLGLLKKEKMSASAERYLAQIEDRTDAMKHLTEELFRYSIVISSEEMKPERVNVVSILQTSLLSFYALMQERGIMPGLNLPEDAVWRMLDAVAVGRLFDRFYTVDAGRNSTGLGLSIARTLTEQMGGSIEAAYQDGTLSIVVCFA